MSKKRNRYTPEFKAKVALAAIKNEETISELVGRFGIHPTMINKWRLLSVDDRPLKIWLLVQMSKITTESLQIECGRYVPISSTYWGKMSSCQA